MKILLLSPKIEIGNKDPPMGLCYIQSYLKSKGINDVKLMDMRFYSYKELQDYLVKNRPDIVGITCLTSFRANSIKLAKMCKDFDKKIVTVMGGPHATFMYKQIMENYDYVDIIALGEGEITMYKLVLALMKNKPLKSVKGITYRKNGKIVLNKPRPLIENLDVLPFPCYDDIDLNQYRESLIGTNEKMFNVMTSRGCPFKCQYCSTRVFWKKWRGRSAKNVADEIEWIIKTYGINHFYLNDDTFSLDNNRVIDICKEIINRKLNIKWFCETRVDLVSQEMFNWMKKAGCYYVSFGVESGSPKILKNINKKFTPEQALDAINMARKAGLMVKTFFMIGNVGETWKTIEETKRFISKAKPDFITLSKYTFIFPATDLYELAKERGIIDDDYWLTDKSHPPLLLEHTKKELAKMHISVLLHYYKSKGSIAFLKFVFAEFKRNRKGIMEIIKNRLF